MPHDGVVATIKVKEWVGIGFVFSAAAVGGGGGVVVGMSSLFSLMELVGWRLKEERFWLVDVVAMVEFWERLGFFFG